MRVCVCVYERLLEMNYLGYVHAKDFNFCFYKCFINASIQYLSLVALAQFLLSKLLAFHFVHSMSDG